MAHQAQYDYVLRLRETFLGHFEGSDALCVGALDINSTERGLRIDRLFFGGTHIGLDLARGRGVDVVCSGHLYNPGRKFDVVYSCECFEHNRHWVETLLNMISLTRSGGLLFFTCATTGREEHGTARTDVRDSPFTTDYYANVTEQDVLARIPDFDSYFSKCEFSVHQGHHDLQFWGIRS